jgi:hypothetical protein
MSYLFIKQSDSKMFKAFLAGREIEVGVTLQAQSDSFGKGDEIEVFYGNEMDAYRAKVTGKKKTIQTNENQAFVMLGVQKHR